MTTYHDCEDYFERALLAPKGIGIRVETPGAATHLIQKMNTYRSGQRKQSTRVYTSDHPKYNKTPWDDLVLRKDKEDDCLVRIEPARLEIKEIVEL